MFEILEILSSLLHYSYTVNPKYAQFVYATASASIRTLIPYL